MPPVERSHRPLVVYADGPDGPLPDPAGIAAVSRLADPELMLGWVVREPAWLAHRRVPVITVMAGVGLRRAVGSGRVGNAPERLSSIPGLLSGRLRPEVAVVGAVADGSGWRLAGCAGWALDAARAAREVVVERWESWPAGVPVDPGLLAPLAGNVVEVIDRTDPADAAQQVAVTDVERRIASLVTGLLPDRATVQWGPGSINAAVVDAIDRPVQVHSGVVTDELAGLERRGLLRGTAETAYLWGGPELAAMLAAGQLRMAPVARTHDISRLSDIPRFVALNAAVEIGLDGSVNVERSGARIVSGPGGHPDFCLAASRSPGGLSVVAARSTVRERSTIVAAPAVVSTPRTDVDVVVTEHGVADLRGLGDAGRAEALVAVADPAHREGLRAALRAP